MNILDCIKERVIFFDGGLGTLLQKAGLVSGEAPEGWNIEHPEEVIKIHANYYRAGSNVVTTNSFGANPIKYKDEAKHPNEEVILAAIENAKKARKIVEDEGNTEPHFVAFDISSTGKLLEPLGDLTFDEAVEGYAKMVKMALKGEPDLFIIETMSDIYEAKAALLAVKENSDLPVFVTVDYDDKGRMLTGSAPEQVVAILESLGADAVGLNCGLGPEQMVTLVDKYLENASVPILVNPNAGLPKVVDGETLYDITPDRFAEVVSGFVKKGVSAVGGCCGTTPEHISKLKEACKDLEVPVVTDKCKSVIASATKLMSFDEDVEVGDGISGDNEDLRKAIENAEVDDLIDEAMDEQDDGCDCILIDIKAAGEKEPEFMIEVINELQAVVKIPFVIETDNKKALENALRYINGKAAVKADKECLENSEFSNIIRKYGAYVIEQE